MTRQNQILNRTPPPHQLGLSPHGLHERQAERHPMIALLVVIAGRDGDNGILRLSCDLVTLPDGGWDQERIEGGFGVGGEREVDSVFAFRLGVIQSLKVCLVADAAGLEGCQEGVLSRPEGWVSSGPRVTAFGTVVVVVVLHYVGQVANIGIIELRQIRDNVVVKVHFNHRKLGFVGKTPRGTVIPVSAVRRYNRLVAEDLCSVDDCCAGGLDERDDSGECG